MRERLAIVILVLALLAGLTLLCATSLLGQRLPPQSTDHTRHPVDPAAWTTEQKWGLFAVGTAIAADCISTAGVQDSLSLSRETNPFLGSHPSNGTLAIACLWAAGTTYIVADALPRKYRGWFLGAIYVIELWQFSHNIQPPRSRQ